MSPIENYINNVDSRKRKELIRIRSIALSMLPDGEESIYYGMPTIKYKNKPIISFDAHKNHIGIYPCSGSVLSKIAGLDKFEQSKGALRESLDYLVPEALIRKIIEVSIEEKIK